MENNCIKIIDSHVHTDHSFDAECSTTFLCETAVQKNISAIAFTDHIEMDRFFEDSHDRRAIQSYYEIVKARSAFRGQILVCAGVEMGEPMYNVDQSEKMLDTLKYDFVIGSVHNLRNKPDFYFMEFNGTSDDEIDALLKEYFDELLLMAEWGKFDTLAHLTYPLRYICGNYGHKVDLDRYKNKIDEILSAIIKNDCALEINTSGLRQKIHMTLPGEDIVTRYKELGGKLITIGSDAHYAEDLGANITDGMALAKRCGFDEIAFYQKREPVMISI